MAHSVYSAGGYSRRRDFPVGKWENVGKEPGSSNSERRRVVDRSGAKIRDMFRDNALLKLIMLSTLYRLHVEIRDT